MKKCRWVSLMILLGTIAGVAQSGNQKVEATVLVYHFCLVAICSSHAYSCRPLEECWSLMRFEHLVG